MEPRKLKKAVVRLSYALAALAPLAGGLVVYSFFVEPMWVAVRTISLASLPIVRVAHVTDIHYRGNQAYLTRVVKLINQTNADLVCFTGDLAEEKEHLDEALRILSGVRKPMYGVPGNHEYWHGFSFEKIAACFRATGGDWLCDASAYALNGQVVIVGSTGKLACLPPRATSNAKKRILLVHFPNMADRIPDQRFDLILAGHSHGGQVRLPLLGPAGRPYDMGDYDRGLSTTPAGPLYVNPGIGTFFVNVRFRCRPEITVVEF
jgi:predicted MPP superfamily phosphohydrolase